VFCITYFSKNKDTTLINYVYLTYVDIGGYKYHFLFSTPTRKIKQLNTFNEFVWRINSATEPSIWKYFEWFRAWSWGSRIFIFGWRLNRHLSKKVIKIVKFVECQKLSLRQNNHRTYECPNRRRKNPSGKIAPCTFLVPRYKLPGLKRRLQNQNTF